MRPALLLAAVLLLAGCSAPPAAEPACGIAPVLGQYRTGHYSEGVTFATGDGVLLRGHITDGSLAHAVLLVHGLNEDRAAWLPWEQQLYGAGYAVLAFDLRGHGESRERNGERYDLANFTADDFRSMEQDVRAALSLLRGRGADTCIVLVGASLGANLALRVAALGPDAAHVDAVALLSPGADYRGVTTTDAIAAYGPRPLSLGAARGDIFAAQSAQVLAGTATNETVDLVDGEAHGTALLRDPAFKARLVDWMGRHG